ncbi:DUF460 domain-containing protein [Candidatus Woesearchaeota archaeon]|nr:DUF460 domain-containing protein [Candidatus Woesearchaeota archaeon]
MKPLAVIGIDPGTTAAFAAIDLQGKIISLASGKEFTLAKMLAAVFEVCQPVIAATDKKKIPSFVEEFSRKSGARLIVPEEDLLWEEKRMLMRTYYPDYKYQNHHQSDCLAAAAYAYKKLLPALTKMNVFIAKHHLEELQEKFTRLALREELHFASIKDILTRPTPENKIIEKVVDEHKIIQKDFMRLYQSFSASKQESKLLHTELEERERECSSLASVNQRLQQQARNVNQRIDTLLKFKEQRLQLQTQEIAGKQKQIDHLFEQLNELYAFITHVPRFLLIKKLNTLGQKEFEGKNKILRFQENDILFVSDPSIYSLHVLQELQQKNITLICRQKGCPDIRSHCITVQLDDPFILDTEYFALLDRESLQINRNDFIGQLLSEYRGDRGA